MVECSARREIIFTVPEENQYVSTVEGKHREIPLPGKALKPVRSRVTDLLN